MNESNPPSPSEEKEISLVTGLPVSKTWYALEPKTNRVLDEDSDLKVLHERVKEKGLEVVYSRHQFEIRAEEESPSPSEEWEKEVRDWWYSVQEDCMGMMHTLPEAKRVDLEHLFNKTLTQQRERLVREVEGVMKKYWYYNGDWHDAECSFILHDEGVCNCDTKANALVLSKLSLTSDKADK